MQLKKRTIQWVLPVMLAALLAVLRPLMYAEAEFVVPSSAPDEPNEARTDAAPATDERKEIDSERAAYVSSVLFTNGYERVSLSAGDVLNYRFTPSMQDSYILRSFPVQGEAQPEVSVRLIREADWMVVAETAQGTGFWVEAGLEAEESYRLEITALSGGQMTVEAMLNARGRCFDNPISLPGESVRYVKTIVHPRDAHWFRFTAPVSGRYMIRTEKSGGMILDTVGYLLDAQGYLLAQGDDILFPGDTNFLIECDLTAGEMYYVRISALSNLTGAYRLVLTVPQEGEVLPDSVKLSRRELTLEVGEEHRLKASANSADVIYASSDSGIVTVEPDGTVCAVSAGEATVWAIAYGGLSDRCRITVRPVPLTGIDFEREEAVLCAGEQLTLNVTFSPSHASNRTVRYESSDETVAQVTPEGVLWGLSEGRAVIRVISEEGGFSDTIAVRVEAVRPVYRALVIGEQNYEGDMRLGGKNTAQGVADMLRTQSVNGVPYEVSLQLDSTRAEVFEGIESAFGKAAQSDVSLLYINCHGAYENGMAYIRLHDESRISVRQLEAALRNIQGKIVIILDFCQSGAFIGAGGEFERFCEDTQTAFGASALTTGRYTVITSASASEDSYRRAFTASGGEAGTAAIMGRSLCEGAGWDLIYDRSVSLKADADRDKLITVQEIYEYTRRRVRHYLKGTGVPQTVNIYPEGDQTVILGRN